MRLAQASQRVQMTAHRPHRPSGLPPCPGSSFTGRILGWSARHSWWALAGSAIVILLAVFVLSSIETKDRPDDDSVHRRRGPR